MVNTTREWQRSLARVGARVSFESLVLEPAQPSAPAGAQPAQIRCQQAHSSAMLCLVSLLSISEFVFFSLASFDCVFILSAELAHARRELERQDRAIG